MLAFILLVVLGGGLGLLAVSLAESTNPATAGDEPTRGDDEPLVPVAAPDDAEPDPDDEPLDAVGPVGGGPPDPEPPAIESLRPVEVPAPAIVVPPPSPRPSPRRAPARPDPRTVPRAFTAVEGSFAEVARAPIWRRGMSLVGIGVIVVAAGIGIAGLLAAVVGAAAEVLNNTIG